MFSRILMRTLKAGIAALIEDPIRVESHFMGECGFTAAEALTVRTLFTTRPPDVIFQYPRKDTPFPMYAVILTSEEEGEPQYLNKGEGWASNMPATLGDRPATISGATRVKISLWEHEYSIWVGAENPDVCIYMYELAKVILTQERDRLLAAGGLDTRMAGGDVGPSEDFLPDFVFLRSLTFGVQRELRVLERKGYIIQDVRGIHVLEPGGPDDGLYRGITPTVGNIDDC